MKTDSSLCVGCNKCIFKCPTHANDAIMEKGQQISVIAAPALRFNIIEYKKLFGYLKSCGVNLIYRCFIWCRHYRMGVFKDVKGEGG